LFYYFVADSYQHVRSGVLTCCFLRARPLWMVLETFVIIQHGRHLYRFRFWSIFISFLLLENGFNTRKCRHFSQYIIEKLCLWYISVLLCLFLTFEQKYSEVTRSEVHYQHKVNLLITYYPSHCCSSNEIDFIIFPILLFSF